jgi:hypothetical protein
MDLSCYLNLIISILKPCRELNKNDINTPYEALMRSLVSFRKRKSYSRLADRKYIVGRWLRTLSDTHG